MHVDCGIQYILIKDQIDFKLLSLSLGKNFGFWVLFGAFLAYSKHDLRGGRYIHNPVRESNVLTHRFMEESVSSFDRFCPLSPHLST